MSWDWGCHGFWLGWCYELGWCVWGSVKVIVGVVVAGMYMDHGFWARSGVVKVWVVG